MTVVGRDRWLAPGWQCPRLLTDTKSERNGGEVGFCNDLRLIFSVLLSASLVLAVQRLKEKPGHFFPKMYVPSPCLFPLGGAAILLKDPASCLIIMN